MKGLKRKIFLVFFTIISVSLWVSVSRQLVIHFRLNKELALKKDEVRQLLERNRALKKSLEEAKSPKFLSEQAKTLLGMSGPVALKEEEKVPPKEKTEAKKQPEELIYQRWWKLFRY